MDNNYIFIFQNYSQNVTKKAFFYTLYFKINDILVIYNLYIRSFLYSFFFNP